MTLHDAFLRANNASYEWLVKRIQSVGRRKTAEEVLLSVEKCARFAENFHPGRFADGAIENIAWQFGVELSVHGTKASNFRFPFLRKESRRRVLHVSLNLALGGHSRFIHHWIRDDHNSRHSVILIDQKRSLPERYTEVIRANGGNLVVLPANAPIHRKAQWLREFALSSADLVMLHVINPEIVSTLAFARHEGPPVAIIDHADHMFWLGSCVADTLINLRTVGSRHTASRRFLSPGAIIPIPLDDRKGEVSRSQARKSLGVPDDQVMLLSVGRAEKYRPSGCYDFVTTVGRILDREPKSHLYVVGESLEGITPYLGCAVHERLHFVGEIGYPFIYQMAADIYLESFPYGSQTALLEAGLSGLPVVPAYAPLCPLLVASDDSLTDILSNPGDEKEYIERVTDLIQYPERRKVLGDALRKRLLVDHVGDGWLSQLESVYRKIDGLAHQPRAIPVSQCATTTIDIGLSLRRPAFVSSSCGSACNNDDVLDLLHHRAFVAKEVGNYATARRLGLRAVTHNPRHFSSWRLFGVAIGGTPGRTIRNVLRRIAAKIIALIYKEQDV